MAAGPISGHRLILLSMLGAFNLRVLPRIFVAALAGSACFYVITNLGVFLTSSIYPHTWAGLADRYLMAVPFFRNTLIGDLVYTFAIFGLYAIASRRLIAVRIPADTSGF